jgi:TolB-like protein
VALGAWLADLRRRRVFRTLAAYGVFAFAVLQVAEPILHALGLPDWVLRPIVIALVAGLPIVAMLAWAFDLTSRGIERTPPAAPSGGAATAGAAAVGRRPWAPLLLVALATAGATTLAGYLAYRATGSFGNVAGSAVPSVAVLPFTDLSPQHDQEHFSDGLAEELLNALAQVPGLRVAGRTSSFSFKGKADDVRAIGQKLGVTAVLEGSVRKQRDRIRVTAHVVGVHDGFDLWSDQYDRGLEDVFQVQEEIAHAVVQALRVKLLSTQPAATAAHRQAAPQVYDAYLVGKHLAQDTTPDRLRRATASLEHALQLDPTYAPAWAELAKTLFYVSDNAANALERGAARRRATEAAERAVALAPDLPDGYTARGQLRSASYDWRGAGEDFERALALRPGDAAVLRLYAGWFAGPLGRSRESAEMLRRALAADPLAASAWSNLGMDLNAVGELDAARDALTRALEVEPGHPFARFHLVVNSLLRGADPQALALAQQEADPMWRLVDLALAHHATGNADAARRALAELVSKGSISWAYQIAEIFAQRGERDQAFTWLDSAYAERDGGLTQAKHDPLLRPLRPDPRWPGLLKKLNLPVD